MSALIEAYARIHCLKPMALKVICVAWLLFFSFSPATAQEAPLPAGNVPVSTDPETMDSSDTAEATPQTASPDRLKVLVGSLTVFVLAIFIGFEVINKVPPTLHTPLMSGSNAISGITVVGALIATGFGKFGFGTILGTVAVVLAMINVAGGFLVTHRMLSMFKKK